jgi:hypothetical protein
MNTFEAVLVVKVKGEPIVMVLVDPVIEQIYLPSSSVLDCSRELTRCPDELKGQLPLTLSNYSTNIRMLDVIEWVNHKTKTSIHFRIWVLVVPGKKFETRRDIDDERGSTDEFASWLAEPRSSDAGRLPPGHWEVIQHVLGRVGE